MIKCYKGGEKHKFKPRYEECPIGSDLVSRITKVRAGSVDEFRKVMVREIYVRDVCEWCGKVVER